MSIEEHIKIIKIMQNENGNEIEKVHYKCTKCNQFVSTFLTSTKRHILNGICDEKNKKIFCPICKKEFRFNSELLKHQQQQKKCIENNKTDILEIIGKNIEKENELLKKQLEELKNDNKELKNICEIQNNEIINLKNEINDNYNKFLKKNIDFSNELTEILMNKNDSIKKKKDRDFYELEIKIIYRSLFIFKDNNSKNIKKQFFILMNYINYEKLDLIFKKIIEENIEYKDYVIEYCEFLKNISDKNIFNKDKDEYIKKLNENIQLYFMKDL
jgi:hypothetical protein